MNQKMKDILRPKLKELREMIFMLRRNALTMAAVIALILILILALLAPAIVPYPQDIADKTNLSEKFQPPSSAHLFGTDELGRDVFSRVLYGTRISLSTAVLAVALSLIIGVPLGAVAGTFGGAVDEIIMRITDIFLSFPPMLLAILREQCDSCHRACMVALVYAHCARAGNLAERTQIHSGCGDDWHAQVEDCC